MLVPLGCALALVAAAALPAAAPDAPAPDHAAALRAFARQLDDYAALHQRLEAQLPPVDPSATPQSFLANRRSLAAAIKSARPSARQGDFFTPAVATALRQLIATAFDNRDPEAVLRELFDEHPQFHGVRPRVYDQLPAWSPHAMPLILLRHLPALPGDVEYRLVDHDLVLWDIHADLILDVLPDAVPRPTTGWPAGETGATVGR